MMTIRASAPTSTRPFARPWWLAPLVVVLGLVATGCDTDVGGVGGSSEKPRTLIVSEAWVRDHQAGSGGGSAAGGSDVQSRLTSLQKALDTLRQETGTGWVGRQDDVTGFLSELTGGSWPGPATGFMDAYGPDLFGVDSSVLRLGEPDGRTVPGIVTTRATQAVGEVPVHDASIVFVARDGRLTGVHGRVFPGLTVSTSPTLPAKQARAIAERASGGTAQTPPSLVVLPRGTGRLAWLVTVATTGDPAAPLAAASYFVDATDGGILSVEQVTGGGRVALPWAAEAATYLHRVHLSSSGSHGRSGRFSAARATNTSVTTPAQPDPRSVEVTGPNPIGGTLVGHGLQTGHGVALLDTTTPSWSGPTGTGGISTYDAARIRSSSQLPGKLVISPDTNIRDPEEIAAQALSRDVYDYYATMGRSSWDGRGGSMVSSVHYGPSDFCNSFFTNALKQPQMVYGNPCTTSQGRAEVTEVEIDTAGHEITHGVTATTAGLKYSGQSGALNESFSDYFGNVIGNRVKGTDSVAIFEGGCTGFTEETYFCIRNPDGSLSLRYMLNGNDFDDYLRALNPGYRLQLLGFDSQDQGGVHYNSAIWNNALWSIRVNLARIDNQPGNDSPLAQAFDRVVYAALTTRLGPTAGFLDARAAVEQVTVDSQLDPVVLRTEREVFDANKICAGCPVTGALAGDTVSASPSTQLHPVVSGDSVAWLDLSGGGSFDSFGYLASTRIGGAATSLGSSSNVADVAFGGDALVTLDVNGAITRYAPEGSSGTLDTVPFQAALAAGLAGSDAGTAWTGAGDNVSFADLDGQVSSTKVKGLGGDSITGLGTGGGVVGIGTDGGRVLVWQPGADVTQVGQLRGAVISVAAYGRSVVAVDDSGHEELFTPDGQTFRLSSGAAPFGVTTNGKYVVWAEEKGTLTAGVAGGDSPYPDTDLYLASLATGKIYDLVPEGGQQGFPSMSGNRLVWQDAAFGGDDVLTALVPDDL
jgi:Zn-dependent metalloprotease